MIRNSLLRNLFITALVATPAPLFADVDRGQAGFGAGDDAAGYQEWVGPAEKGDADAQFRMGELYRRGLGVGRDMYLAAGWYRRAAVQNHVEAIIALGEMYLSGNGARSDEIRAWQMFDRAAQLGSVWAANRAGRVWHGLSDYQRREARPD